LLLSGQLGTVADDENMHKHGRSFMVPWSGVLMRLTISHRPGKKIDYLE